MKNTITTIIQKLPSNLKYKFRSRLRQKAILRTKARLAERQIDINRLTDEELEIIIQDEEDKLIDDYKSKGIIALLALLGISWF